MGTNCDGTERAKKGADIARGRGREICPHVRGTNQGVRAMATPPEATSEWVRRVEGRVEPLRYAATPEEVLQRDRQAAFERHTLDDRVDAGGCTQVTLHKSRAGKWTLLLNGRESVDVDDRGRHALPRFDPKLIREDATGRELPAPVRVAVVLEQGSCTPESLVLEVMQGTFVAGVPVDEGTEQVVTEVPLEPARVGDPTMPCVMVAYPMALGPSAQIQLIDRSKRRAKDAKDSSSIVKDIMDVVTNSVSVKRLKAPFENLIGKLPPWLNLAGVAGYWYYFTNEIRFVASQNPNSVLGTQAANAQYTTLLINAIPLAMAAIGKTSSTPPRADADDKVVDISVFDLPKLLRRVSSSQTGGLASNQGVSWTPDELRKAKRSDDAALLEYLIYAISLSATERQAKVERWRQDLANDGLNRSSEEIEDLANRYAEFLKAAADELKGSNRNQLSVAGVATDSIKARGRVESMLRLRVVDAHQDVGPSLQTFTLTSPVAFEAGLFASGYVGLAGEIRNAIADLVTQIKTRDPQVASSPLVDQLLLQSVVVERGTPATGRPKVDLADFLVGRNRDIYAPSLNALAVTLENLSEEVTEGLDNITMDARAGLSTAEAVPVGLVRLLPHLLTTSNRSRFTFAVERDNESIDVADSGAPSANSTDGLRDAVQASVATVRIVSRAIAQFLETEGVTRPRARTQLVVATVAWSDAFVPPPEATLAASQPLPSRTAPSGIQTRHVYAPRLPLDVVGAMACRAEDRRVEEALAVRWLTAPGDPNNATTDSAGVAARFGVPSSHIGELVLGTIADLATDEALDRARTATDVSPTRAQLMASAVQVAVERLMVARDLARVVFRERPVRVRVADHDALFTCYPEGATLRKLLHESAVWRGWKAPWFLATDVPLRARYEVRAAAASASPQGVRALEELLDALKGLRRVDERLSHMPFLAPQTMAFHTDEALHMLRMDAPSNALVLHNAWAGLAAQVEHSYFAAQRLHVLAMGLRLSATHRATLRLECVLARPILELVPTGTRLERVPRREREWLRLLTRPVAELLSPLQPGVDALPSQRTLLDRERAFHWLRLRLATMRMDLRRLKAERVLDEPGDVLIDSFARMDLRTGPVQYLVPFGAAVEEETIDAVTRCFEDAPVYVRTVAVHTPDAGVPVVVQVRTRRAHDTADDVHPLALTLETRDDVPVAVGVTVSNVSPIERVGAGSSLREPSTLHAALAQVRDGAAPLGLGVDAAGAFVFAVERLVQSALVVAGSTRARTHLRANPPPPPIRTEVYTPHELLKPAPFRLAERRVWALLLLIEAEGVGLLGPVLASRPSLMQGLRQRERDVLAALDKEGRGRAETEALVAYLVGALDGKNDDALDGVFRAMLTATLPAGLDIVAYLDAKQRALTQAQVEAAQAQGGGPVAGGVSLTARVVPVDTAIDTARYLNRVREAAEAQFVDTQTANRAERAFGLAENDRALGAAKTARRAELRLWPMVLAVANAVLATSLTNPPTLWHDDAWEDEDLLGADAPALLARGDAIVAEARAAWEAVGLVAAPLCELAAVVVGGVE